LVVTNLYLAMAAFRAAVKDARGQGLAEYALAAGLLAGLGFAVLALFQQWIEVAERALLQAVNG
jgi:hypothetical protein